MDLLLCIFTNKVKVDTHIQICATVKIPQCAWGQSRPVVIIVDIYVAIHAEHCIIFVGC